MNLDCGSRFGGHIAPEDIASVQAWFGAISGAAKLPKLRHWIS